MELEPLFSQVIESFAASIGRYAGRVRADREAFLRDGSGLIDHHGRQTAEAFCVGVCGMPVRTQRKGIDWKWDDLLRWYDAVRHDVELHRLDGHNFDLFSVLSRCGVKVHETAQSSLLAQWLDPRGVHGQGALFQTLFLEELGMASPGTGVWRVATEENRVDLLLSRSIPFGMVVIENKSNWAVDQPNQLYRYWYRTIYRASMHA